MSTFDQDNRFFVARFISLAISILGLIMMIICGMNGNLMLVYVSIAYSSLMFLSYICAVIRKTLTCFYCCAILIIFALEFLYLKTGGTEGFGMIWLSLVPLLSLYLLETKSFIILNAIMTMILMLFFWTPLYSFCYKFSEAFRARFPLVLIIEVSFGIFLKNRIENTERNRSLLFDQLNRLQENLQQEVLERTKELMLERNNRETLMIELTTALAATIDAKDKYTSGHSQRVAEYSKQLAKRLGYNKKQQDDIYLMGLLHDIGKIGIPDDIINKTSKLTDDEFAVIKKHLIQGSEILASIKSMPEISYGARWHHERWDGKGYPDKLSGNQIPRTAQIISVADSYDAMTSTRSYRAVLEQKIVKEEIIKGMGTQFNPEVAKEMLQLIEEDKDYKMHE